MQVRELYLGAETLDRLPKEDSFLNKLRCDAGIVADVHCGAGELTTTRMDFLGNLLDYAPVSTMDLGSTIFWVGLAQIIGVNIVLSGDNAVVIALAARSLPPRQQTKAIFWGSGAAVALRILLTIVAVELLRLPYLKFVGAALLLWIGIKLLVPEDEGDNSLDGHGGGGLAAAIRTILIADLVMGLDNVIAVAAAAKESLLLLILGLAISIPLVIFGSTLLIALMQRYAFIITIGAALIGWVAGEMAVTDPSIKGLVDTQASWLHLAGPLAGAVTVIGVGRWRRGAGRSAEKPNPSGAEASSNRSG